MADLGAWNGGDKNRAARCFFYFLNFLNHNCFETNALNIKRLFSFFFFFFSNLHLLNFGIQTRIFIRTCGAELWNCFESIIFKRNNDLVLINVANVVILARIYINKSKTRLHRDEILWYCRMSAIRIASHENNCTSR